MIWNCKVIILYLLFFSENFHKLLMRNKEILFFVIIFFFALWLGMSSLIICTYLYLVLNLFCWGHCTKATFFNVIIIFSENMAWFSICIYLGKWGTVLKSHCWFGLRRHHVGWVSSSPWRYCSLDTSHYFMPGDVTSHIFFLRNSISFPFFNWI